MPTSQEAINNTESKEYTITRLNRENLRDLAALHAEVYKTGVDENYFIKKYDTAYTGLENVGYIAYNIEGKPVAYYGVIPCLIEYRGQVMLAAQSADTMTHPGHRYKGMFVDLSNRAFELCMELGIRFVFGFPNQNSYHGAINKLGWKMTEAMVCFIIPVKSLPVESFAQKMGLAGWYKRYCRFILKNKLLSLQGTVSSVIASGFAGVYRNEEYFSYKTYSCSKTVRIGNSKIWISDRPGLLIGDMENVDETNFKAVIKGLKQLAKRLGKKQIQFHCSPGTSLHQLFSANYREAPSYPALFQDFGSPIAPENIKFTFADIDIF